MSPNPWGVLGIEPTRDVAEIRRAYAAVLKRTRPEEDPAGFAELRQAYERALAQARAGARVVQFVTPVAEPVGQSPAPVATAEAAAPAATAEGAAPAATAEIVAPAAAAVSTPAAQPSAPAAQPPAPAAQPSAPVAQPPAPAAQPSAPAAQAPAPAAQPSAPVAQPPAPAAQPSAPAAQAPAPVAQPSAPAVTSIASPTAPAEIQQLRSALLALKQAAVSSPPADPKTLQALLDACLNAPALENLSVQLEFEPVMVQFLIQTQPVTRCLLETVIQRWQWRERLRTRLGPGVAALLAHAENLEQLQKTSPSVHRALTRAPQPLSLWIGIVFFGLHRSVREALGQFRGGSPDVFNPQALQWWSWFLTEPHAHPVLIRMTVLFMSAGALVGGFEGRGVMLALSGAMAGLSCGALAGFLLTGLWWGLVDWPRHKLRALRQGASRGLRLGWAPACLAACALAAFLPNTLAAASGALVVSLPLVFWAVAMAPGFVEFNIAPLQRVWGLVLVNLPLALWWLIFMDAPAVLPTMAMSIVFVATLLSFALGQSLLWREFLHGLRTESRQAARWGVLALALGGLALALLTTPGPLGSRLILMCLVAIVLAQRTPASNITGRQLKIKYYAGLAAAFYVVPNLIREGSGPVLQLGGALFMSGVIVSTAMGFYNEWRATREVAPAAA